MPPLLQGKVLLKIMDYIAYLSKEEIKTFILAQEVMTQGYAYEWEGEQVVHIHTQPLLHAFGATSRALFFKDAKPELSLVS